MSGLIPLIAAAVGSALLTALSLPLAHRLGAVARVSADRWHSSGSVPRFAGPGLLLAVLPWLEPATMPPAILACAIGSLDDIWGLSAKLKAILLLLPSITAAIIFQQLWLAPAIWLVANAVNLLDHADALAATAAGTAFAASGGEPGLACAGACLGFLLFNFPPARCFMGDGGSLLLGTLAVLLWRDQGALVTAGWCAVPLADAVFVTLRRLASGRKPWVGGTDHSGHILLRLGVRPRLLPPLYGAATLVAGLGVAWLVS